MTTSEASRKWGFSVSTIVKMCSRGLIAGVTKVPYNAKQMVWCIPDDAEAPEDGRKSKGISRAAQNAMANAHSVSPSHAGFPLTMAEIEGHILRFGASHTYKQLREDLGIPREEIRQIYDRLHAQYGI